MTIQRYELAVKDIQEVEMPQEAKILSVTGRVDGLNDPHTIWLWCLVNPYSSIRTKKRIWIAKAGTQFDCELENMNFIGTVVYEGVGLVWHVFEG